MCVEFLQSNTSSLVDPRWWMSFGVCSGSLFEPPSHTPWSEGGQNHVGYKSTCVRCSQRAFRLQCGCVSEGRVNPDMFREVSRVKFLRKRMWRRRQKHGNSRETQPAARTVAWKPNSAPSLLSLNLQFSLCFAVKEMLSDPRGSGVTTESVKTIAFWLWRTPRELWD